MDDARSREDSEAAARFARAAIEAHEEALRYEPRFIQALAGVARIRLEVGGTVEDVVRARDELARVLEMDPGHILALNNRAIALLRLALGARRAGRAEEAERGLAEALESVEKAIAADAPRIGPNYRGYARGWANKAYVLRNMGRLSEAADAAKKVREISQSYKLNDDFVAGMAKAGHPIPPATDAPALPRIKR